MKTTQAWGWLAAGVLALGLNGFYQDGGAVWAHRIMDRAVDRSAAVLALASGRSDRFLAKTQMVSAREQTHSCRLATAVARFQSRIARTQTRIAQNQFAGIRSAQTQIACARFEEMSAREEAQLARLEANRARIEAQTARLPFVMASFNPVRFDGAKVSAICPRVRVLVPQPKIDVSVPMVHAEMKGTGPI